MGSWSSFPASGTIQYGSENCWEMSLENNNGIPAENGIEYRIVSEMGSPQMRKFFSEETEEVINLAPDEHSGLHEVPSRANLDSSSRGNYISSPIDLKLGRTSSSDHKETVRKNGKGHGGCRIQLPLCQVFGCSKDLSLSKDYYKRHRVCEVHSKTPVVIVNGTEQRFCQQCSRFHFLAEFDDGKRSCRRRLACHNQRRRKPRFEIGSTSMGMLPDFYGSRFEETNAVYSMKSPLSTELWHHHHKLMSNASPYSPWMPNQSSKKHFPFDLYESSAAKRSKIEGSSMQQNDIWLTPPSSSSLYNTPDSNFLSTPSNFCELPPIPNSGLAFSLLSPAQLPLPLDGSVTSSELMENPQASNNGLMASWINHVHHPGVDIFQEAPHPQYSRIRWQ